MNDSINISNLYIEQSTPLTRFDLANNFCVDLYGYFLTILIIVILFCVYERELKRYAIKGCDWLGSHVHNKYIKKNILDIPDWIEWSLYFLSFTGCGVLIMFYWDYITIPQIIILTLVYTILFIHRLIDAIYWISLKLIAYSVKKGLSDAGIDMENIKNKFDNLDYPLIKEVKEVKEDKK